VQAIKFHGRPGYNSGYYKQTNPIPSIHRTNGHWVPIEVIGRTRAGV
jgi:hypothetical protein